MDSKKHVLYLSILDRVQAFEILGDGKDHHEFVCQLCDELKLLNMYAFRDDDIAFNAQADKVTKLLDDRWKCYSTVVQRDMLDFIRQRRGLTTIEGDIAEINNRTLEIRELITDKLDCFANCKEELMLKLASIEKRIGTKPVETYKVHYEAPKQKGVFPEKQTITGNLGKFLQAEKPRAFTYKELSEILGLTERQIWNAMDLLRGKDLIKVHRGGKLLAFSWKEE